MNRLLLCAGSTRREGWKSLDMKGGDYQAVIPPLPIDVLAVQWDEIEWIHGINAFYPWEGNQILHALHVCMRPGGLLVLEQPNFDMLREMDDAPVQWFFGDPGPKDQYHMAKWCWSPMALTAAVQAAGFRDAQIKPAEHHVPSRDFRLEARA